MTEAPQEIRRRIEADIEAEEKRESGRRLAARFREAFASNEPEKVNHAEAPTYFEQTGLADCDYVPEMLEITPADRKFAWSAEGDFLQHCRQRTGETANLEKLQKRRKETALLLDQTNELAAKMDSAHLARTTQEFTEAAAAAGAATGPAAEEAAGFAKQYLSVYRQSPFQLLRYFVHSRQVEEIPAFRRTCFLPYVAQRLRAPIVNALEFFLSLPENAHCRFWTFSSGPRVLMHEVRETARNLAARLGDLAEFLAKWEIRLVFRSTELGTPKRDAAGRLTFNVHAHCIVKLPHYLEQFPEILSKVKKFWRHHWKEGKKINKARECCKYVVKPGELMDFTGEELIALQAQLSRLKLVQPLGELLEQINKRNDPENPRRLVRKNTPEGTVFQEVKNWNRHGRKTRTEKNYEAGAKIGQPTGAGSWRLVARSTPIFNTAGISEPTAVIMTTPGEFRESEVRKHPLLSRVIEHTAERFAEAQRAAAVLITVHTRTPTPKPTARKPARGSPLTDPERRKRAELLEILA